MADRNKVRIGGVKPWWIGLSLLLLSGLAIVAYRPDRPVATIVPGSSSGPAFVVQVIRPRVGLPLGGILPPQLFGLEEHLGFDLSGWVTARFTPEKPLPKRIWGKWLPESYELTCGTGEKAKKAK